MPEFPERIPVGPEAVSALFEPADAQRGVFVAAHGAGGSMHDRGMSSATRALRDAGLGVVRFNFPYRERKSGRPDPMPRLMETVAAVAEEARRQLGGQPLMIGGRSMGGRAASMLAAERFPCAGLLLLAYPLHPAGKPEQLRDGHLARITTPVLCFNGTRDSLCRRDLMDAALRSVTASWTMHWLEGADHGFHVLKSSGRTDADVLREMADVAGRWVARLADATAPARRP